MKPAYKALAFVALLVILGTAVVTLPVRDTLGGAIELVETHRAVSWPLFVGLYIVAAVMLFPGSILTLGAGFLFGLPVGLGLVSVGSTLGAACAFLIGRFLARDWVAAKTEHMARFRALDRASRSDGFLIVLLTRLSPVFPFNLINYGFGLTGVTFGRYFFATWLGMLPGTAVYVYIGTLAADFTQIATGSLERGWLSTSLLVAGFVATIALTILVTRRATRALREQLGEQAPESA